MTEIVGGVDYSKSARHFSIVAKRIDSASGLRALTATFGISGSRDEALDRVVRRARGDVEFLRRWAGWMFVAVEIDHHVQIGETGAVLLVRNDKSTVAVLPPPGWRS